MAWPKVAHTPLSFLILFFLVFYARALIRKNGFYSPFLRVYSPFLRVILPFYGCYPQVAKDAFSPKIKRGENVLFSRLTGDSPRFKKGEI